MSKPKKHLTCNLFDTLAESLTQSGRAAASDSCLLLQLLDHLVHGNHQKSACATSRIEHPLTWFYIEHTGSHALHIPGREELTPVTAQVCANKFLVGFTFHVYVCV